MDKKDLFGAFSKSLDDTKADAKKRRQSTLKEGLEKRRKRLRNISSLKIFERIELIKSEAGLDPYSAIGETIKSPRINRKGYLSKLKMQLLRIGNEELDKQYSVITLEFLEKYFTETRKNWEIRPGDLKEALNHLEREGLIHKVVEKDDKTLVYFTAIELNDDLEKILITASGIGEITIDQLASVTGWDSTIVEDRVSYLEEKGLAVRFDEYVVFPTLS